MTIRQELSSWLTPPNIQTSPAPTIGNNAPTTAQLQFPTQNQQPVIVTFLRHCGCPFAEKTFLRIRDTASKNPDIHFVAVSHSNNEHTTKWRRDIGGQDPSNLEIIVDEHRETYAAWGLGVASFWHVLNPQSMYDLYRMAVDEKITNRPTQSGYRWQTSGSWAIDEQGTVVWGGPAETANVIPNFVDAVIAVHR